MQEPRRIFNRSKASTKTRFVVTLILMELAIWIGIVHGGETLLAAW